MSRRAGLWITTGSDDCLRVGSPTLLTMARLVIAHGKVGLWQERVSAMKLLTLGESQPKAVKGEKKGYLTAVLHLAPHTLAGVTGKGGKPIDLCPMSDSACRAVCLNTAGHRGIVRRGEESNSVQEARKARTRMLFADREAFVAAMNRELDLFARKAARKGMGAALHPGFHDAITTLGRLYVLEPVGGES